MTSTYSKQIIAAYNEFLHNICHICPGNHQVEYSRGDLYLDGDKRDKELTLKMRERARQAKHNGITAIYSPGYNTFVFGW